MASIWYEEGGREGASHLGGVLESVSVQMVVNVIMGRSFGTSTRSQRKPQIIYSSLTFDWESQLRKRETLPTYIKSSEWCHTTRCIGYQGISKDFIETECLEFWQLGAHR